MTGAYVRASRVIANLTGWGWGKELGRSISFSSLVRSKSNLPPTNGGHSWLIDQQTAQMRLIACSGDREHGAMVLPYAACGIWTDNRLVQVRDARATAMTSPVKIRERLLDFNTVLTSTGSTIHMLTG